MVALPKVPALSVGTDICQISRIFAILATENAAKFVRRVLTEEEISNERGQAILKAIAMKRHALKNPLKYRPEFDRNSKASIKALEKAAQYVAGRWAAKEAVRKAYTVRRLNFHDVEIKYEQQLFPRASPEELAKMGEPQDPPETPKEEILESQDDNPKSQDGEPETSLVLGLKPMYTNWGPPIAIIKGGGVYEDEYARISISHDGNYAMASCVVDMKEPKLLKKEESGSKSESDAEKSQSEVD
ncbi:hypothetical protein F4805DRAFT_421056 [Annulohypoxylon moriforme]|nr:hypothetical protein F4805DRAFT_421056 [Annulohypoxylon moriforme]